MLKFAHFALAGALFIAAGSASAQTPGTSIPLTSTGRVLGPPGIRRDAGTWLFNNSMFVAAGSNRMAPGSPVFLANLRRDKKDKLPLFRGVTTTSPLNWATLPLPTLREMIAPGFNFAALQTTLAAQVASASSQGQVYVGWSLPVGDGGVVPITKVQVAPVLKQLRAVLDAVAPTSALILDVDATKNPLMSVTDVDAAAASCDALLMHLNPADPSQIWPIKMARRQVEMQPNFDLPVFIATDSAPTDTADYASRTLEYFMGGATGFIGTDAPAWVSVFTRNPGLFSNAVTLEDAAVLPSQNTASLRVVEALRAAGRVPLVGVLPEAGSNGESLIAVLDNQTTLATLSGLDAAARAGNAIYMEGVPDLKNKALLDKLVDMTSTTIEVLPTPRRDSLNPDDPWVFGDARNREFDVMQSLKWTIKSSLAGQANVRKGEDTAAPYAAGKLATDVDGILVTPLGKGRLTWLAHTPLSNLDSASMRSYYTCIAGSLQGGLASWKFNSVEDEVRNGGKLRLAVRASKAGTPILTLWNDADVDANITLSARGDNPLAYDLLSEKTIEATVRGYLSTLKVSVPAHGYVWLTFGATKQALDKERLAALPKAKVVK